MTARQCPLPLKVADRYIGRTGVGIGSCMVRMQPQRLTEFRDRFVEAVKTSQYKAQIISAFGPPGLSATAIRHCASLLRAGFGR